MKAKTYIKLAGGTRRLGQLFKPPVTRQAVQQWKKKMPMLRIYQLRDIRPDWFDPAWLAANLPAKKTRAPKGVV